MHIITIPKIPIWLVEGCVSWDGETPKEENKKKYNITTTNNTNITEGFATKKELPVFNVGNPILEFKLTSIIYN